MRRQPSSPLVETFLVTGPGPGAREAAIAAHLKPDHPSVIILEGLSDGAPALVFEDGDGPAIHRIAPGCLHCSGNLILRVTLNRVLRFPPARLYISLATATHIEQLRNWLIDPPYGELLSLQPDLTA